MCASESACTFVCVRVGGISIWKLRNSKQTKRQKGYTNVCSKGKTPSTVVAAASCSRKRQKRKKAKKPKGKIPEKAKAKQQERSKNKKQGAKRRHLKSLVSCAAAAAAAVASSSLFSSPYFLFLQTKKYMMPKQEAQEEAAVGRGTSIIEGRNFEEIEICVVAEIRLFPHLPPLRPLHPLFRSLFSWAPDFAALCVCVSCICVFLCKNSRTICFI